MNNLPRVLKASLKDDIRRIPFNSNDFTSLKEQICKIFSLEQESFILKYKDDEGDMISFSSNEEFKELLSCTKENIIRIFVIPTEKQRKGRCKKRSNKQTKESKNQDLINPILLVENFIEGSDFAPKIENVHSFITKILNVENENNEKDSTNSNVHSAFCDRCDEKIIGIRWKCFDCNDFDFCNSCYNVANGIESFKNHSKDHQFGKIENPNNSQTFQNEKEKHFEKLEQERIEKERLEKERIEKERIEKERIERERLEKERLEKERLEKERIERERLEKEKLEKKKSESSKNSFQQKLELLESMGFSDRKKNINLLIKNVGNVDVTINELLNC